MTDDPHRQQSSDERYLSKLTFNPELRNSFLNFFVSNVRVVILLIVLITIAGLVSFFALPRESNPEVKIPIAIVAVTYPGVSPADMEELVTKKVETGISGLKGVKTLTSNTSNSLSVTTVEFEAGESVDDAIRSLRDQVTSIKGNLPTDALDPIVREISIDDAPIWSIQLSGPASGLDLRRAADNLKDELEKISGVREVRISGGDTTEFDIAYDPKRLTGYGLTADQANAVVKATNLVIPAGTFEGTDYTYTVRTDARFFSAVTLGAIALVHSDAGSLVHLRDVATVTERSVKRTILSRLTLQGKSSQDAVTLSLIKKVGGNVIQTIDDGKAAVERLQESFPPGTVATTIVDQSDIIRRDFDQLIHDFILTIILVGGLLFLIVGLKEALVAGLAIPLVFFVTFATMRATGLTLNFLSMFSLILALGLLVDDAIVVVSATKQYLNSGKFTPEEAVLLVLDDFKVVLTTTTLTTVWAFLPLLMSSGIIGLFIRSIPITVSTTLIASLIIALMVNHPLAAALERIRLTPLYYWLIVLGAACLGGAGVAYGVLWLAALGIAAALILVVLWALRLRPVLRRNADLTALEHRDDEAIKAKLREQASHNTGFFNRLLHGVIHFNAVLPLYERTLRAILATRLSRGLTLAGVSLLFAGAVSLPLLGAVPTEFFPAADADTIYVNIEGPIGVNLASTDAIVRAIEPRLQTYPEVQSTSALVGTFSGGGQRLSSGISQSKSNIASITVNLLPAKERTRKSYVISKLMREDLADITTAKVTINDASSGPSTGAAFEARISGDELQTLDRLAQERLPVLQGIPGVLSPDSSLKNAPAQYTFTVDQTRLELYSLTAAQVGSLLRMAISGSTVTTVLRDGKEINVTARVAADAIQDLEDVQNLALLNNRRQAVALKDVATVQLTPSVDTITRINQKRVVLLSAGVEGAVRPNDVVAAFQKGIAHMPLPEGYAITYGGENEQNAESVASILQAMLLAGLLIVSTMVIQFNSFRKAGIVLVTIPLALIGVFGGLAVTGIPLSFPGLIGIVALFGIVVKNAIILIDKMNLNLRNDIPFIDAVVDAGRSRLEAIFITSIATIVGIIPITLSNDTWTALGGSMIFGLMFSSFFTLFIVPTLFVVLIRERDLF
ncbi:MAG: efflux RND transporter permease subunit [Thermoanaerobaculia bacterium]|nr:efflux RND transporter permease subunit [Thermoanaerobaculia bacterium]